MEVVGMDARLTPKQERFVQGLFAGLTQREAWKQAYDVNISTDKSIDEDACRLANNVKIVSRLDQLKAEVAAMNMVTEGYVIQGLIELQQRCMQKIPVMEKGEDGNLVPSGEWKFDSSGANSSLEKLGKYLKMFTDKVESKNVNLNEDVTKLSREEREKILADLIEIANKV
jgi:phage terminase small subunit